MHGSVHLFDRLPEVVKPTAPVVHVAAPVRQVPLVGVIRNARSHREMAPVENSARATLLMESPGDRADLPAILSKFAERRVDYIVLAGGDGTVRDVLTCGAGIFGESWPPLIVLPNGKTNALAVDLGLPLNWSLTEALDAIHSGQIEQRRPLAVSLRDNANARVQGFVLGAGAYTAAIQLGQKAHKKGAFNSLGVGITVAGSLLQALFGSGGNVWRRGTPMRLFDGDGREVEHSGIGRLDERFLLFTSTLRRFPAGLRPFLNGNASTMRTAMLDSSSRSLLLRLPMMIRGKISEGMRRAGYQVVESDSIQLDISDRFILDGEAFPGGRYQLSLGPKLRFVVP